MELARQNTDGDVIRREIARARERQVLLARRDLYRGSLEEFAKRAWLELEAGRELVWNWHLTLICEFLEAFYRREFTNGIINIPYRLTKSTLVSVIYPAWVWAQEGVESWQGGPGHQFLSLSHKDTLATRDALKTRILIESEWYKSLFPEVKLQEGQNEKTRYGLVGGGHRIAIGSKSGATGESSDTIIYDDPHDAEKAQSEAERSSVTSGYDNKIASRLNNQSKGGKLIIMQRLHEQDLTGHVIEREGFHSATTPQGWVKLCLPMRYELDEPGRPPVNPAKSLGFADKRSQAGELLDKTRFPESKVIEHEKRLGEYGAAGQFQQRPSPKGGGILQKSYWRIWPDDKKLPNCDHVFLSWDTAYTERDQQDASYSARTVWGVFWDDPSDAYALLLLGAWWDRVSYPDLRRKAQDDSSEFRPDSHLIEKKASGQSLIQDLRRAGHGSRRIRIRTYSPDRDKIARAHAASSTFSAGLVYAPNKKWAQKVIDLAAVFPAGAPPCSDITDTITQAVVYLTRRWWVQHPDDVEPDEPEATDIDEDDAETQNYGIYG